MGEHTIAVSLAGQPLGQSPYKVNATGSDKDADAKYTRAYGPGLEGGNTSEPCVFTIETYNHKNERVKVGGAQFSVDVNDPVGNLIDAKIKDNGDGTYNVQYQPQDAGLHTVEVMLHNKHNPIYYDHIQKSPFKVNIEPGVDANLSYAYGPG